jgi:iron-sulfur cluster repair protein YtfE (RIC family)
MSEAVLKNIEKELPKLQAELASIKEAAPKSEALMDLIDHIVKTHEPFYESAIPKNPWLKPATGPCCCLQ